MANDLKTLDGLRAEIKEDVKIDETDPGREALRVSRLRAKYLDIQGWHKRELARLEREYNKKEKIRLRYFEGKMTKAELDQYGWEQFQEVLKSKAAREQALKNDEFLAEAKKEMQEIIWCLETLEKIEWTLTHMSRDIRSFIDWERIQKGM